MTGFRAALTALLVLGVFAATGAATYAARSDDNPNGDRRIAMRDDCDPNDPAWANFAGGCARARGHVSVAEFFGELSSPLSSAVVGHQSWRNDPSYLVIRAGQTVLVRNAGGRPHTFTAVANFGGGKVPPLNQGLVVAPECPGSTDIPAGGNTSVSGLAVGNHRYQCCIHPWMRELIKVTPSADDDD